jgi:hypothetical protein
MLGTRCQSWALWLAEALELPYTNLAVNGAQARDLGRQVGRMRGPYELCCLYAGVNDARAVDFDAGAFAAALGSAASAAASDADHLLMVTIPLDLGRPRAGRSVLEANRLVREVAGRHGATVVALEGLRGWRLLLPDAVHVTARGQVEIAERAARALRADGLEVPRSPAALAEAPGGWRADARYALNGHAAALARDLRRRVRERRVRERRVRERRVREGR